MCCVSLIFFSVSNLYFTDNKYGPIFLSFEVVNEKLDLGCYCVFSYSSKDDQNELLNKSFEQIGNFTILEKKLKNFIYLYVDIYD